MSYRITGMFLVNYQRVAAYSHTLILAEQLTKPENLDTLQPLIRVVLVTHSFTGALDSHERFFTLTA